MRINPDPLPGSHPAAPELPPWHPINVLGNPVLGTPVLAGLCGVSNAFFRKVFRRPKPFAAATTAAWVAVVLYPIGISTDVYIESRFRHFMEHDMKAKIPKRPLFDRVGHLDPDDLVFGGLIAGSIAAGRNRARFPGLSNWKWAIGFPCVYSLAFFALGQPLIYFLNRKNLESDMKAFKEAKTNANALIMETLRKKGLVKEVTRPLLSAPPGGSPASAPGNPLLSPDLPLDPATLESIGPGKAPHELAYDTYDEKIVPIATTDYRWNPPSSAEGQAVLNSHVNSLLERRQKLVKQVEWLWQEVAIRENKFSTLPEGTEKDVTRKKLELLGSMHKNLWVEISEIDWMVSDSRKRILQLRARDKGEKWLPPTSTGPAEDKEGTQPVEGAVWDRLMRDLKNHQENLQTVSAQLEEVLSMEDRTGAEKDEWDMNMKEVKQNEEATEGLIRDFERRGRK